MTSTIATITAVTTVNTQYSDIHGSSGGTHFARASTIALPPRVDRLPSRLTTYE